MSMFSTQRNQRQALPGREPRAGVIALLVLVTSITLNAPSSAAWTSPHSAALSLEQVEWVVQAEDSVCGVVEARQIRKPAKVDFDRLVDLTPEGKKILRDKIDLDSAEGVRLMNRAKSRVRDASAIIMKRQGYDSVWKDISSKKGTHIADLTAYVEIEIQNSPRSSAPARP